VITSANAARHAGADLKRYAALPLFVVGAASAHACREQGLEPVMVGESNAAALVARIAQAGHARVLHLCGADVTEAASGALDIVRVPVYRSVEGEGCDLSGHLHPGDILLVHSPPRRGAAGDAGRSRSPPRLFACRHFVAGAGLSRIRVGKRAGRAAADRCRDAGLGPRTVPQTPATMRDTPPGVNRDG
jgi:hypothetical protein